METQYTGKLDISRLSPTHSDRKQVISITLHDDISGAVVLEIQLTPEMLGMALTGRAHIPCTFQLYGVSAVGKQRETKTEDIEIAEGGYNQQVIFEELRQKAIPFEVDGWMFNMSSMTKLNRVTDRTYRVDFLRYVEANGG